MKLLASFEVVNLDIPGLPVDWLVIEDDKLVCLAGDDFPIGFSVVERDDASTLDSDRDLAIFQYKDARGGLLNCHELFRL